MPRFDLDAHLDQATLLRLIRPGLKLLRAHIQRWETAHESGWEMRLEHRPEYLMRVGGSLADIGHGMIDMLDPHQCDPCERLIPPWHAAGARKLASRLRRKLPGPLLPSRQMGRAEIEMRRLEIQLGRRPK